LQNTCQFEKQKNYIFQYIMTAYSKRFGGFMPQARFRAAEIRRDCATPSIRPLS
jgi:hypothetical protein